MSQIMHYFLHSTLIVSIHIEVILSLSTKTHLLGELLISCIKSLTYRMIMPFML